MAGTGQQAAPTPTATARPNQSSSTSPLVAILVLLVPLIIMVWKSRGAKAPKISAASCLPVIDENKRPFQIHDD